ncbi:MAG TPA: TIR domain-containing protein [Candidatus Kapabacteria bacterium]
MADIFISYSSKDREKAEQLTELLASAGLSVWIDKHGIDVSTSWSKEIVQAIDGCKALVVLLSPNSVVSVNVAKEVSLAAEQKKKILPLDLEPVELTDDLRYHLAGLQRAPMTNIDAIIRAIGKLGLEATQAPTLKLVKETDSRKSLMILPFEDLSPTADNQWFADGLASELISALSNVRSLRLMDQQETKSFKSYKGHLTEYARIMKIRYFVQGSVRKFGDQIKITAQLLDIDTGDYLWQHSMKGVMENIFDIQEEVAQEVLKGLEVNLTSEEKQKLTERGTENIEAYELYLKAQEYYLRQTKEGFQLAAQVYTDAIRLDPDFADAYCGKALALVNYYRVYSRDPELLVEAERLCRESLRLKPDRTDVYLPLSITYMFQGKLTEAEATAKEYIRIAPNEQHSHFSLGFFYTETGQPAKAICPYEDSLRLKPDNIVALYNVCIVCNDADKKEKCRTWALAALPIFERHLRLHPDDESRLVSYADLLHWCGRMDEARSVALRLRDDARDGKSLYNTAALFSDLGDKQEALATFRKAIQAGFRHIGLQKQFLSKDIGSLSDTPEYEEVKRMVEKMSEP